MELQLTRKHHPQGTNSELCINGKRICYTIELPWQNNRPQVSCIPEGCYTLKKRYSARFGWHLLVENVPGRSGILFHAANDARQELRGCIAPVTTLTGPGKGILSRIALKKLVDIVTPVLGRQQPLYITIKKVNNENTH